MAHALSLRWASLAACLLMAACSSSHVGDDAGARPDSALADSGLADGGSSVPDAARPDAGMCNDPSPGPSRPVAWECSPCRQPGPDGVTGGECTSDTDCSAGDNGRCQWARIGGMCSYDECFSDAGCAPTELCACDGGFGGGNACIEAGCHTDADCGSFDCSPTLGDCGHYFPPVGYFCHGPGDECYSDADCAEPGYCARNPLTGGWACSTAECVG